MGLVKYGCGKIRDEVVLEKKEGKIVKTSAKPIKKKEK
jgi:hypothetical protein